MVNNTWNVDNRKVVVIDLAVKIKDEIYCDAYYFR